MSAATGRGLDRLSEVLKGRVSVVAGPSGVGKSSLINAIKLQADAASSSSAAASSGTLTLDSVANSGNKASSSAGASSGNGSSAEAASSADVSVEEDAAQTAGVTGSSREAESGRAGSGVGSRGHEVVESVIEPVEQWRGMQAAVERLGLQPVGDLTNLGRGKHTTRHVSLLEVRLSSVIIVLVAES